MPKRILLFISLSILSLVAVAQNENLSGTVTDEFGQPIEFANVYIQEFIVIGTTTDANGFFELKVPTDTLVTIKVTALNKNATPKTVYLKKGETEVLNFSMKGNILTPIDVYGEKEEERFIPSLVSIDPKDAELIPNAGGGIEGLIEGLIGVQKNNELSSAYSVRGGNFDENLVYVNDFEVYRPFLIRSGQQEGLSFVNPDMVKKIDFSAGGFQAKYGDKMSSVLDVTYRRPTEFSGSVEGSLLGGGVHLEGLDKTKRFTYSVGVRSRTSRLLLGSQDIQGQYAPAFVDAQSYFTYQFSPQFRLEYIANYARNKFDFVPEDRTTEFGLINFQAQFQVFYEGEENDKYESFMNGFAAVHNPTQNVELKYMASTYAIGEQERFDIIGDYFLGELETDPAQENAGEVKRELGSGTFHDWARNELVTQVYNVAHKGTWEKKKHEVKWGVTYKKELIKDKLSEWERLDSSGYSLPYTGGTQVQLFDVLKAEPFNLNTNRFSGYFQDTWKLNIDSNSQISINYGVRAQYWSLNKELIITPRFQFSYKPKLKKDFVFTAAAGMYAQPPFYREMRNLQGEVNTDLKAQKSAHFVAGFNYAFTAWKRPFRFVTETYYKYMWDLVPYEFDNVLIRYFGENNAKGYAAGIDLRLHGELAKDAESWVSLSYMKTEEDILDDFYTEYTVRKTKVEENGEIIGETLDTTNVQNVFPGNIPRPTDQRLSFALFFQDYVPKFPYLKVHMKLVFGTGLPFGPPNNERYQDNFRISPYRRFDIGFSALLFDIDKKMEKGKVPKNFTKGIDKIWLSLEVFNLFGIQNTVSYFWVNGLDVRTGQVGQYAIPNYLTNRRVNLRFKVDF